jgi:hypothetical protein
MSEHTPTPWFVSGVRFRMNGSEWQSVNRYDEALKRDENVACVGYDPRNGAGAADAHFIVKAVNNHRALVDLVQTLIDNDPDYPIADNGMTVLDGWRDQAKRILAAVGSTPVTETVHRGSTKE